MTLDERIANHLIVFIPHELSPGTWAQTYAPEVKRLIEAAYQQGLNDGLTNAEATITRLRGVVEGVDWDALLSVPPRRTE